MRLLMLIAAAAFMLGCTKSPPPPYDPANFRGDVDRLIHAQHYETAIVYLGLVDVDRQVEYDGKGYLAVGEDLIELPSVDLDYDRSRDWFVPGTSDAIEHAGWQKAATEFAARYNQNRQRE